MQAVARASNSQAARMNWAAVARECRTSLQSIDGQRGREEWREINFCASRAESDANVAQRRHAALCRRHGPPRTALRLAEIAWSEPTRSCRGHPGPVDIHPSENRAARRKRDPTRHPTRGRILADDNR